MGGPGELDGILEFPLRNIYRDFHGIPPRGELMTAAAHADPVLTEFVDRIGGVRPAIERLVLFGSRARGDHRPDSDYDLLVVVTRRDPLIIDALYEGVMDILLAHGRLVSLKIIESGELARLKALGAPFVTRVAAEGIAVG